MAAKTANEEDHQANASPDATWSQKWTRTLQTFTKPLLRPVLGLSHHAATYPKTYIVGTIVLSIAMMIIGISTNFTQETDDDIWTPQNSRVVDHGKWFDDESGFPKAERTSVLVIHRDGKNLFGNGDDDDSLALESAERMFESIDHFRATPRFDELCSFSDYTNPSTGKTECQIVAASTFWNDTTAIFEEEATSNQAVLKAMSAEYYPFGGVVDRDQIIGYNDFDDDGVLKYGETYVIVIFLPVDEEDDGHPDSFSKDFEEDAIDRILDLQDQWAAEDGNDFRVEIITDRSFEDEFMRAMTNDLPFIPVVFVLMSVLCIGIYARHDAVLSRSWVGFGAVVTVLLSLTTSFGLLFTIGVPFTSLTPLLPFIIFGVGLDDAFIISGAFSRTNHTKHPVDRIQDTMEDIGGSILLTTLTATAAFALGAISDVPAVGYLVFYAFPTIMIDFIFQITFFVAIIVIDQRRIEDNRRDCCFCHKARDVSQLSMMDLSGHPERHFADILMGKYAKFLLKPRIKWMVIVLFAALLSVLSWRTSELTQYFDFTTVIPSDSYIQTWWDAYNDYYEANGIRLGVFFRDVDFSDKTIRDQMEAYVADLAAMPYSGEDEPFQFWLWDFDAFVSAQGAEFEDLDFEEQIKLFLADPVMFDAHGEDIVLNDDDVMTASRTLIRLDNVDEQDVLEVVDVLQLQRSIAAKQPVNQGLDDWAFFSFSEDMYIWEFYEAAAAELRLSTIIGTVTVAFLAMIFIPHWTAVIFVCPMVAILYIELLGFMEICGVHVNPISYISFVMSIGLIVDHVMHVTLRFVQTKGTTSRTQKTTETLETIGASVFVGGMSTLLGVIPLAFSSSEIFFTTFIIFFGLVLLGLLHGLVLLPVLFSMFGPLESIFEDHQGDKRVSVEEQAPVAKEEEAPTSRDVTDSHDDPSGMIPATSD